MGAEIWDRVIEGRPLVGLEIGEIDGRLDLNSIAPARAVPTRIEGVAWDSLHFTRCDLNNLRLLNCTITNCVFQQCNCESWRVWASTVSASQFRVSDLRSSSLGAELDGKRTLYRDVEFDSSDLRDTSHSGVDYSSCRFSRCRIKKVDFGKSSFMNCSFIGELREVVFNSPWGAPRPDVEIRNLDLTQARLRYTAFHSLDLDSVRFPEDDEHIICENYPAILDELLEEFRRSDDIDSQVAVAGLEVRRSCASNRDVVNKKDLRDSFGVDGAVRALEVIRRFHSHEANG